MHNNPPSRLITGWYATDLGPTDPGNILIDRIVKLAKSATDAQHTVIGIQLATNEKDKLWDLLPRFNAESQALAHDKGIAALITNIMGYNITYGGTTVAITRTTV